MCRVVVSLVVIHLYAATRGVDPHSMCETDSTAVSGRLIVQPPVRNQVMHEMFVDMVDGRWDESTGELVARGSFRSVKDALPQLKAQGITALYLMGALDRDNGSAPNFARPDASPFAVVNRSQPNEMLGGSKAFIELTESAANHGIKIIVDSLCQVSSSHIISHCQRKLICYNN